MNSIYQQNEWATFLLNNKKITSVVRVITLDNETYKIHYYLKKIGPFSIIGAPLFATTTGPMNLVLNHSELNFTEYVKILKKLGSQIGVLSVEILDCALEFSNGYNSVDKNIQSSKYTHYEIDLMLPLESIKANFSTNVKRKLKKAEKNNLQVKIEKHDIEFADKFYHMLLDVFKRQGKKPTYPQKRVRDLLCTEELSNNLLCLGIYTNENVKIASGIFVYNASKSFFWGGASYEDYMFLCPNELMHFEAIKVLKYRGVRTYEFGGGGSYKERYGPARKEGTRIVYSKYYWILNLRQLLSKIYKKYIQKVSK